MPLFGSNKHVEPGYEQSNLTGTTNTHTGLTGNSHHEPVLGSTTHGTHTGTHTGAGGLTGTGTGTGLGHSGPGTGIGHTGPSTGIGHGRNEYDAGLGNGQHTMGTNAPSHHVGGTHGTGMGTHHADNMIPAHSGTTGTAAHHGTAGTTSHSQPGKGTEIMGKIEHAVGTVISSQSMKAKGAQKEHAAHNARLQNMELNEADRLDGEAAMRRERAANYGAGTNAGVPPQNYGSAGGPGLGGVGPAGGSGY